MLKIRLKRIGRRGMPSYRVVVMRSQTRRDGKAIEDLGFYNPISKQCVINKERIKVRLSQGAQMTETVKYLYEVKA
jgi:small subunit ribosomal protein S16|uniref:Small ribosomal subunit protein bS16c n=2 Tax=Cyanidioschyzon merolae TaxID=45157 RepID=RR16_CYAM1|nr:30S ribosomal protein S16 [Cyanidioschyzon merolae strain 10D]Q85G24.1 RecName: Full=Small ribosomal subunit protein bS16c; AltName: Full=30S ribosomal protein S16, chloroplastic [Cyanidioschyzon merolae strain 10D]QFV16967.1 30S ribosomal protein S16 [Cyanidioschyzon merolae]QFV17145.1 30S ribosomal protein S16 [Cyanidioschyzon merolae]BAC76167.1 30S ribosomal protein S16 [Cyanidioschyzon merolae strain 10D]